MGKGSSRRIVNEHPIELSNWHSCKGVMAVLSAENFTAGSRWHTCGYNGSIAMLYNKHVATYFT